MRIASLLASGTEMVCGMGLEAALVAISHECDFPSSVLELPRVTRANIDDRKSSAQIDQQVRDAVSSGAALYSIDEPRLAALRPDVIITQAQCDVCAIKLDDVQQFVKSLPEPAPQIVALNPATLDEVFRDILALGKAVVQEESARRFVDSLRTRLDQTVTWTRNLDRPRVAIVEWSEPLMIAANWSPQLVELAGGNHSITETGRHSTETPLHRLREYNPQILIVAPCGFSLERSIHEARQLLKDPQWAELDAVASGQVYAMDGNAYLNRSGPRLVDTVEMLAQILHPQHAPQTDAGAFSWCSIAEVERQ